MNNRLNARERALKAGVLVLGRVLLAMNMRKL